MDFYTILASSTPSMDLNTITYTEFTLATSGEITSISVGIYHIPQFFIALFIFFIFYFLHHLFWRFKKDTPKHGKINLKM